MADVTKILIARGMYVTSIVASTIVVAMRDIRPSVFIFQLIRDNLLPQLAMVSRRDPNRSSIIVKERVC